MPSPHPPLRQPNRECLLAAGVVTTGSIHSPWNLSFRAVSHSGPAPLLAKYIRATPTVDAQRCCVSWTPTPLPSTWLYGPALSAVVGAELNRRLRNAGIPKRRSQGPVNCPTLFVPGPRRPSPTSILTYARPTSPAALTVGGPSRTVLEQCFRREHAELGGPEGEVP